MAESNSQIYQFRVALKRFKPPIWRRILVPADFTFDQLHLAIQCAFGWSNTKKYDFIVGYNYLPREYIQYYPDDLPERAYLVKVPIPIGIPNTYVYYCPGLSDALIPKAIDARCTKLTAYFKQEKTKHWYNYELGFPWGFYVLLEKILPRIEGQTYPQCTGGRLASPAEFGPLWYDPEEYSDDDDEIPPGHIPPPDPKYFDCRDVKFDRYFSQ